MPFTSGAPELSIEIDAESADTTHSATRVRARALVRLTRPLAVQRVRVEFVGEESVSLRAWVPLSTTTQAREITRQTHTLRDACTLAAGTHEFAFELLVPWWVPSSLVREMCQIRYVVRLVVERASLAYYVGAAYSAERELACRRVRVAGRLARRKRVDQSVGCPDGSCHVRVWGAISRDVVKPGTHLRLDLAARTSDARFGLRVLAAHFAECVMCHVQVKGEERLVDRISHLATCRLDDLGDSSAGGDDDEYAEPGEPSAPESQPASPGQLARRVRKTRSRLAVLLRNANSSVSPPPVPGAAQAPPQATGVARQVRASQVMQVPQGLSQFASEYVSREYRLVVVAVVAPLEHAADAAHSSASAPRPYQPQHARSAHNLGGASAPRSSSSSSSSAVSLMPAARAPWGRHSEGAQPPGRRRQSESGIPVAPPTQSWAAAEQSSAIASWKIDVVDHFDVQFDALVSPEYRNADASPTRRALSEPEFVEGEYAFVPPSPVTGASTPSLDVSDDQQRATHRRTSSGLVGFLMRGFRSTASSPSSPPIHHARSSSGGGQRRHPRALSNPPKPEDQADDASAELVLYPLAPHKTFD
ncbi:hypothetical protein H4S02_000771 [Coemansia sp. RSA 2611]|nr:hypothetical protein H4S01_000456 [Coemansia sp. RSA 2610]KAJ2392470.1 hypothetical protein H4S02_000771 [Coemansia sp. RSA 2611]